MNFIKKIRENLKDPKKKSITLLGIYFIFFVLVFILLKMGDSSNYNYEYKEPEEKTFNYEYTYKITDNENIIDVYGTYSDNIDTFNYNGINYVKQNNVVYLDNLPIELDFDIDKYKYDKIELLTENSDSETTYKDSNMIVYNLTADKYFNLLVLENNCGAIDCKVINVLVTVEKEKLINYALIDLSNYYGYKYNVEIWYNSLN